MTSHRSRSIEQQAADLLRSSGSLLCPVPLERIARHLGLRVEPAELGDDVSGILVVEKDMGSIGYNLFQHPVRQRFSIAHEIGHFVLHHRFRNLFIDKHYTAVYKRHQPESGTDQRFEVEANRFAACLLMPRELLSQEIPKLSLDLGDESALQELADAFAVSTQAMSIRLSQLGVLTDYS